jgi:hypothetical protein
MTNQMSSRASRLGKLGVYFALLAALGLGLTARTFARAAGERSLLFGQQLGSFQMFAGRSTDVVFNGQPLTLHTRLVKRPIRELLDDFAALCKHGSERATAEFAEHLSATPSDLAALQRLFVMRDRRGDAEGTALCFAGLGDGSLADVAGRFGRFAQHLDVSELGALRYVYLRKNERGTHVILVTSPGPLSLARLWPEDGRDVDGVDPIAGARPKDSVRFISARLAGAQRGLTAYRTTLGAGESLNDYAQQAAASGHEVLDFAAIGGGEKSLGLGEGVDMRMLRKHGETWIATAMPDGDGSYLSVVQL